MTDAQSLIITQAINAGSSSAEAYTLAFPTKRRTNAIGEINTNGNYNMTGSSYVNNTNFNNYTYIKSSATVQKTYSTNSYAVLNPTSVDLHTRGQVNYWVTGSTIIPASALNSGSFFVTSSTGLGPVNTSAKVSITSSYFTSLFNSNINDANDVKKFGILSYNGVISTIAGYNDFSSSTFNNYTQSFVVIHISASKANMGNVVTSPLYVTLGTTQNSSTSRNGNDSTTNVSGHAAFEARYPSGSANRNGRR